jgi:membrane-associated protease RseP (regulator of RpoE activity)
MLFRNLYRWPNRASQYGPFEYGQPQAPPSRLWVHVLLFLLTVLTTTTIGAMMEGKDPFGSIRGFASGFPFSFTILAILGIHEFAHYIAGKRWGISVTLPYFIPAPFPPIGTFGAVIRLKSSIPNRKALVDVGVAGPIAGFVVAVAACIVGLTLSHVAALPEKGPDSLILGDSLLFKFLSYAVIGPLPLNQDIMLHPIAFAGWIGLFVTGLNLMPFGQLDGGHVLFALSPKIHDLLRRIRVPLLVLLGLTLWSGWFVWALLLLFIGGPHPYPDTMEPRLGPLRTALAVFGLVMFFLCIIPAPVKA